MEKPRKSLLPVYADLIIPTYKAMLELGGSGTNDEICDKVIELMKLSDEVVDEPHLNNPNQSELEYKLAWIRTYLKNYGVIERSAMSVWCQRRLRFDPNRRRKMTYLRRLPDAGESVKESL
jgi:restriction system protein